MSAFSGLTWPIILSFANLIFSTAIVITAFSLLGYMLTRNFHSSVAQAFSVLLACVLIVFAGDIVIPRVEGQNAVLIWLRVQWIGIAIVPAAYLHFSDAVLSTTRHFSRRRRVTVAGSYVFSALLVILALFTDALVFDGDYVPPVSHLSGGPLFPLFVAYFAVTALYGAYNIIRARHRCLTPTSRRRMTYLTLSFAAPGVGVFPYVIAASLVEHLSPIPVLLLSMVANGIVGAMLVVMAYSVAYYGVLSPDRVIKHDLIHYLLRGPVVGIAVIAVMLVVPRVELILGLPRDTALIFAVVGVIVLGQLAISAARPWLDRLIFRQDREELSWIQTLDRRLLTSSDLRQFLVNVLTGLCELLRVDTGFVLVQTAEGFGVEAAVGPEEAAVHFAADPEAATAWQTLESGRTTTARASTSVTGGAGAASAGSSDRLLASRNQLSESGHLEPGPHFVADTAFWFCPLRSQDGERMLGLLAVAARSRTVELDERERDEANALLAQAAAALADRYVQQGVFATLQSILPDLERIQEWRSALRFAPSLGPVAAPQGAEDAAGLAEGGSWQQWVKDALSHYWGGPKLTENPLTGSRLVRRTLATEDGNIPRAMRAVLRAAIERQRPAGDRKLTASEWVLYNILEMRFLQGQRVRDIANRLAMSESDLYRKQRTAVAEVAKTLADMEAEIVRTEGE